MKIPFEMLQDAYNPETMTYDLSFIFGIDGSLLLRLSKQLDMKGMTILELIETLEAVND